MKQITVALAGNPNSGKSSVFNMLTGARQHVGNYPGVTVEKKEGVCTHGDYQMAIVDLPGTYSLTAYSTEELIARHYVQEETPDVVVDVVDASNLERNLYLATQLIEMDVPLVLAFNMSDVAKRRGIEFDLEQLSLLLEAKIVPTVGNKRVGREALLEAIVATANQRETKRRQQVQYGAEIEEELAGIQAAVEANEKELAGEYGARWIAVKLLEQDEDIIAKVKNTETLRTVEQSMVHLRGIFGDDPEIVMADRRYGFISGACQEATRSSVERRHDVSDSIDAVVTNRIVGLPIFLLLMYVVFFLTFKVGSYPMGWLEQFFGWLGGAISSNWPGETAMWLRSLVVDGIIGGVGGVLVFLPNILLLFMAIALLEDSGYMARAAFVMDRIMHKIGLHGKSFIPMLIGFGCSVPAIMATRILENRRSRLTTIMVIPLMSCGARLAIYALFIPAFFPVHWQGPMLWIIYLVGIVLGIAAAKVLRLTVFKGETVPFVMELPPYRMPTFKGTLVHTWQRGWMYIRKAGTVILGLSIVLWFAMSFPSPPESELQGLDEQQANQVSLRYSVVGRIGQAVEPIMRPLGFDWKIDTALIGAVAAKELFVSQLGIVYAVGSADEDSPGLRQQLRADYSPLTGLCVMLFCLISAPCVATVAMTRQETNSWRWALFQFFGLTALAYVVTLLTYQVGRLLV